MSRDEFRRLVALGALPQPRKIGPHERWYAPHIKCISIGAAYFWSQYFDSYEEVDWAFMLSIHQSDRPYRYVSPKTRAAVFDRDGSVCRYCGDTAGPFHIDHVHPVRNGGDSEPENLCVACAKCNLSKRAMSVEEWRERAGRR